MSTHPPIPWWTRLNSRPSSRHVMSFNHRHCGGVLRHPVLFVYPPPSPLPVPATTFFRAWSQAEDASPSATAAAWSEPFRVEQALNASVLPNLEDSLLSPSSEGPRRRPRVTADVKIRALNSGSTWKRLSAMGGTSSGPCNKRQASSRGRRGVLGGVGGC